VFDDQAQRELTLLRESVDSLVRLFQHQHRIEALRPQFAFDELLDEFARLRGTFLHVNAGAPPTIRAGNKLLALTEESLTPADCRYLTGACLSPEQLRHVYSGEELDLNLIDGDNGFRIHAYLERGCPALSIRRIRADIPKLVELGLSGSSVESFLGSHEGGLMLLTGRPRSGKFNTYASLIQFINHQQVSRIVSVEPVVQFWHRSHRSIVVQREVGSDTRSFARAVRIAVQQDPDILCVGAIPDPETAEVLLQAAAGGHLVIAMMDGSSAVRAVDGFLSAFDPGNNRLRLLVARVLRLVVCQHLVDRADGRGQDPAYEILECNRDVREAVQRGDLSEIHRLMSHFGMQTLGRHLSRMIEVGLVNYDDALKIVEADQLEVSRPSQLQLAPPTAESDVDDDTPLMDWL
jgi:twitching motility protein PilT